MCTKIVLFKNIYLLQILSPMKNLFVRTILHQILSRSNKSRKNSIFLMRKVGCLVNLEELLLIFLGGSVMKVELAGVVKKKRATSVFGLQVMLGGSICVSCPCTLQLYCGTISELA